jgi:hypothetical protein
MSKSFMRAIVLASSLMGCQQENIVYLPPDVVHHDVFPLDVSRVCFYRYRQSVPVHRFQSYFAEPVRPPIFRLWYV